MDHNTHTQRARIFGGATPILTSTNPDYNRELRSPGNIGSVRVPCLLLLDAGAGGGALPKLETGCVL